MAKKHKKSKKLRTRVPRRTFLRASSALGASLLWTACGGDDGTLEQAGSGQSGTTGTTGPGSGGGAQSSTSATGPGATTGASGGTGGRPPTPECAETEDNIEGPFYKAGAPDKTSLYEAGMPGTRLTISGQVFGLDGCEALAGAVLDVWQADDAAVYDGAGYKLRGKLHPDADGKYVLETIIPGHYLNGAQYRPAHVHVKASAPGHVLLTTQLYFEGDPYNDIDPFIKPELIMTLSDGPNGEKLATFDFVLAPSP